MDSDALAKGWLLTLIAGAPLQQAASVPAGELARDAPPLCAAMTAALASNDALDRLRGDGDLVPLAARAGRVAGAVDPAGTAGALAALRTVLWDAIADGAARPGPRARRRARGAPRASSATSSPLPRSPARRRRRRLQAQAAPVDDSPRLAAVPDDAPAAPRRRRPSRRAARRSRPTSSRRSPPRPRWTIATSRGRPRSCGASSGCSSGRAGRGARRRRRRRRAPAGRRPAR